jgi:serine kinase of HPr protein (carbohydrate metabolism regulator)
MLRGPSGAGKSLLALALLEAWEVKGAEARLVSDDRLDIEVSRAGLVMHAPPAIAGLIELRGRGIVGRPHVARAPLHLVVDLVKKIDRMVEEDDLATELYGVRVARCPVPEASAHGMIHQMLLVSEALRALSTSKSRSRQKTT